MKLAEAFQLLDIGSKAKTAPDLDKKDTNGRLEHGWRFEQTIAEAKGAGGNGSSLIMGTAQFKRYAELLERLSGLPRKREERPLSTVSGRSFT